MWLGVRADATVVL